MADLTDIKLCYCVVQGRSESMGRGELVNLLLKDSGLKYEYDRIDLEHFKANKHELVAAGLVQPTIPYLIANGKYYGKAYPILRFLSRKLGKYDGKTDDEIQFVDALADAINDWYTKWGTAIYGGQERHVDGRESFIDTYNNETFPASLKDFDAVLAKSNGPYLIGEEPTYADFMLYHVVDDSQSTGACSTVDYPNMHKFMQAIENRPNLKDYIASLKNKQ